MDYDASAPVAAGSRGVKRGLSVKLTHASEDEGGSGGRDGGGGGGGGGRGFDAAAGDEFAAVSFVVDGGAFVKDNVAIMPTGVALKDASKTFVVDPDSLVLGDVIGRGASSYVQRAVHAPTGTPVALKVMNLFDKSKRGQLVREIQALYHADCDCLISFFGAFHREGAITIALEYMDMGTLANVVSHVGHLPERACAAVAYQMLWALAYMRVEKRLHRDIKPSNILINLAGQVKASDFGLSSELRNSIGMAATFTGTCRYMSPERILHKAYSFPSDMWSLGIVLLEAATGEYPFPSSHTYIDMAETIVDAPVPTLPADGRFSPEFAQVVAACLHKNPDDRLPADILLGSTWFTRWGITSLATAVEAMAAWIATIPQPLLATIMASAATGASPALAAAMAAPPAALTTPTVAAVGAGGYGYATSAAVPISPGMGLGGGPATPTASSPAAATPMTAGPSFGVGVGVGAGRRSADMAAAARAALEAMSGDDDFDMVGRVASASGVVISGGVAGGAGGGHARGASSGLLSGLVGGGGSGGGGSGGGGTHASPAPRSLLPAAVQPTDLI